MMIVPRFAAALALITATWVSVVDGALMLEVSPGPGVDDVTWSFSGSAVAGAETFFDNNEGNISDFGVWQDVGDFTAINDFEYGPVGGVGSVSGAATLTIDNGVDPPTVLSIAQLYIDTDGGDADDIGITYDDPTNSIGFDFSLAAGDVVSWAGSLVANSSGNGGIDLYSEGGLPFSTITSNLNGVDGSLELQISIVPEATSLAIAVVATVFCAACRRHAG